MNKLINIDFSLPISENPHAIDYVLPDYNEIKQGYVQPLSSNNDNSKKNPNKQQQQVSDILQAKNFSKKCSRIGRSNKC